MPSLGKEVSGKREEEDKKSMTNNKKKYGGQGRSMKNFIMNYLSTVVWEGFVLQQLDIHEGTMS